MIKIKVKIRNPGSSQVIVIHSKNLVEKVRKQDNKVSIEKFKDGLILKPGGKIHATIGANKWIQITITKLIKKDIVNKEQIKNKELIIYLDEDLWGLDKIFEKSVGSPITNIIPNKLVSKKAGVRTNKKGRYLLDLSIKKLYELTSKEDIKCLLNRKENIILVRSEEPNARKLTPHSDKRVQICIPKEILTKSEIETLNKKGWLPIELKLNIESFGLKTEDFYNVNEEKEIAKYLIENNIEIKIKNISDPYDIYLPEYSSCIEVHNSIPGYSDLVTRHKIRPAMVRLRILEAIFLTQMNRINNFFLVFNEGWSKGKYIQELNKNLNKKIHIIYTNFKDRWYESVGNEILKKLK